jgi:hypothetical protein
VKGWIYILSNESFPEYYKVGTTTRDPEERIQELFTTGVPTPFILEYSCLVESSFDMEQFIHQQLDPYRVNGQREFFECGLRIIISTIKNEIAKRSFEILFEEYGKNGYLSQEIESYLERGWDPKLKGWEVPLEVVNEEEVEEIFELQETGSELDRKYFNDALIYFEKRIRQKFKHLQELRGISIDNSMRELLIKEKQLYWFLSEIKDEVNEFGIREYLELPADFLITDTNLIFPINSVFNKKFDWFKYLIGDFLVC